MKNVAEWRRRGLIGLIVVAMAVGLYFGFRPRPVLVETGVVSRGPLRVALEQEGRSYFGYPIVPAGVLYHPAREVILKADRGIQPEKLQLALQSALRRSGMVLSDPQVLRAMEHSALESPHYLPIKVKKDGSIADGVASAEQLGKLGRYVDRLLHQIAITLLVNPTNARGRAPLDLI